MPPEYELSTRTEISKKLEQVRDAVLVDTDADPADVESAHEQSQEFLASAFDFFSGGRKLDGKIGRAFVVPMRSDRANESYASESLPFYPLLDPHRFGVASEIRMRTIYGLPPTVLDTYMKSENDDERGALVLAPLYSDMAFDVWVDPENIDQAIRLSSLVTNALRETTIFAHRTLGANYLGLGATLPHPNLTNFGRKIRDMAGLEDVVTTTGHGGTVFMLAKTVLSVLSRHWQNPGASIGLLGGAGSTGWSTILAILDLIPDIQIQVFDKREDRMRKLLDACSPRPGNVVVAESAADVLAQNKLVVSAITETIDLDDPRYADIDFTGTVWIDDSQPGSVDRAQLENRGGNVIWVVGQDDSANGFMTKDGVFTDGVGYNYGTSSGLFGPTTEFACGLEAAVVAASADRSNAVSGPVTIDDVARIGRLFDRFGVNIASYQSFGQPVQLA